MTRPGRTLEIAHPYLTFDSLVFDGQFGTKVLVIADVADHLILRGVELRRSARDCFALDGSSAVLIEGSKIHHCLRWEGGRVDAHGLTGSRVTNLTVRDTDIFQFSGDAIQFDPSRAFWDQILIERCHVWLAPLPKPTAGFPAGATTGENGFDAKTPTSGPRSRVIIRESRFHGFRSVIPHQGALNLKERIEAVVERSTIWDSDVALRVRGPALVTIVNNVLYDNPRAIRYEDRLDSLHVYHNTFGSGQASVFQAAGGGGGKRLPGDQQPVSGCGAPRGGGGGGRPIWR